MMDISFATTHPIFLTRFFCLSRLKLLKCLKVFNILFITSVLLEPAFAQPSIQWQKSFGGSNYDAATSIQATSDGGYIISGFTQSKDGDVTINHGVTDLWITKLDSLGNLEWQKTFGGSNVDAGSHIIQTSDDGFVLIGFALSNDGDVSENHGEADFWVVKLTSLGAIQWQRSLGGSAGDEPQSIRQTIDGGFIIAGFTGSNDGDVSDNHGFNDYWVVKLNTDGAIEWQKTLGGSGSDEAYSIEQVPDGGFIVAGSSSSNDGDVSGNHGNIDYWAVKLNNIGEIEWQKTFGGSGADDGGTIIPTMDGGYIMTGTTGSSDGQVSGVHGQGDAWILKLDTSGEIQWNKVLGGSDYEGPTSIFQTSGGAYILSIFTFSTDGDVIDNDGGADAWIVKLSNEGEILWQNTFGGSLADAPADLKPTNDGGYIFCGYSASSDGDVSVNYGILDLWIVKLSPESSATTTPLAYPLAIYPNPAQQSISLQFPVAASALNVCISDVLGQSMIRQTGMITEAGSITLEVAALPAGVYLVSAVDEEGQVFSGRFVRQ